MGATRTVGLVAGIAAMVLSATPANASVTLGSDLTQIGGGSTATCQPMLGSCTVVNTQTTTNPLTSPIDGVIVRWRVYVQENSSVDRLRVVRLNGNNVTAIRSAPLPSPPPASFVLNVMPLNPGIPISVGDSIGFDTTGLASVVNPRAGTSYVRANPLIPDGATEPGTANANAEIPFNADIEPDCDADGFGDETQDPLVDCVIPETQITKGPKDKTRKKRATFEFNSNEPGATFECSLDGGAFAPCTSPDTLKVKRGKHSFQVRARDAGDNADASPASDEWKVKRRKRR